jgi:hypothetical protein
MELVQHYILLIQGFSTSSDKAEQYIVPYAMLDSVCLTSYKQYANAGEVLRTLIK